MQSEILRIGREPRDEEERAAGILTANLTSIVFACFARSGSAHLCVRARREVERSSSNADIREIGGERISI